MIAVDCWGRGSITPISYAFALSCSSTRLWGFTTLRMARVAFHGASVSHWTGLYYQSYGEPRRREGQPERHVRYSSLGVPDLWVRGWSCFQDSLAPRNAGYQADCTRVAQGAECEPTVFAPAHHSVVAIQLRPRSTGISYVFFLRFLIIVRTHLLFLFSWLSCARGSFWGGNAGMDAWGRIFGGGCSQEWTMVARPVRVVSRLWSEQLIVAREVLARRQRERETPEQPVKESRSAPVSCCLSHPDGIGGVFGHTVKPESGCGRLGGWCDSSSPISWNSADQGQNRGGTAWLAMGWTKTLGIHGWYISRPIAG